MWLAMLGVCSTAKRTKREDQDVIDSLSVLEAVMPTFHAHLSHHSVELFLHVILPLRSRFVVVRQSAAHCFSTGLDALCHRDGGAVLGRRIGAREPPVCRPACAELFYNVVHKLGIKALPYVIFMVVPVLGRMGDGDDDKFPEDSSKRRDSKVEQYKIPVTTNAELRECQEEGVNWLAFLAKYQPHGRGQGRRPPEPGTERFAIAYLLFRSFAG
ncbi:hypothetical protein V8D89_006103 [Ganoderma adspersum]